MKVKAKYQRLIAQGDYRQYVGPVRAWRSKGALQFLLCTSLGLRPHHDFLDIGCGSLRAGRWFIPYLNPDKYHGIEPMAEMVALGLEREVGQGLAEAKNPVFWHNGTFSVAGFNRKFDMMLCHAVMIHIAKPDLEWLFDMVAEYLEPGGLFIGNYHLGDDFAKPEAVYPEIARYRSPTIRLMLAERDLTYTELPLRDYNPRCRWFVTGRELTDSELALVRNVNQLWAAMRRKGL